jgi:seryl-tRNA synthetase
MIDVKAARTDPDAYRAALARRGYAEELDTLLAADERRRGLLPQIEELRARRKLKGKPTPEQMEELEQVKAELHRLESELTAVENEAQRLLDVIPNLPDPEAPDGVEEEDAVELRRFGEPREFGFEPLDHLGLG